MIKSKLIHFETRAQFDAKLKAGEISLRSIVLIKDTGELWTRNKFYAGTNHNHDGIYLPINGTAKAAEKLANIITTFSGKYPVTVNVNGIIYSHAGLQFEGSTGTLTATKFKGILEGNASSSTTSKYQEVIDISGFVGKTVLEAKNQIKTIISQNANKGLFILNLNSFGEALINNWNNDSFVLTAGNTYLFAEVTCALSSPYAFVKFTTYGSKKIWTSALVNNSWGSIHKIMHTDDTAVDSSKLGGILASNYYHSGNSNKLTINWAANTMNANSFVGTDLALSGNALIQNNQVWHAGIFNPADKVNASSRSNWNDKGVISNVIGQLAWKNYGNGHTIFDASNSTTPSGTSCNNTNPSVNWSGNYPTLMGWNGSQTYGVRVDSARNSDLCSGLAVHGGRNNEANKIVRTDSNGYIQAGYINSSSGNENNNSSPDRVWGSNATDGYLRTYRTSALSVDNSAKLGGIVAANLKPKVSLRDFTNGTLIRTSIDYSQTNGAAWYLKIHGNIYINGTTLNLQAQGYIYNNTIINTNAIYFGTFVNSTTTKLIALNVDGKLCFWFARQGYWAGYNVECYDVSRSTTYENLVTSIDNVVDPVGTKRVEIPLSQIYSSAQNNIGTGATNYAAGNHTHSNFASTITTTGSGNAITALSISGNTITANKGSSFLPLNGGTMTGTLKVASQFIFESNTTANYKEGIRLNLSTSNWAGMVIGGARNTTEGCTSGSWWVARNPSAQFVISPDDSSATVGLTLNKGGDALWRNSKIWTAGNFNPDTKLNLSGGTMTGTLTGKRITAIGTGNDYYTGCIELLGNGATDTIYPTLGFHQPSKYASSIQLRSAANFYFMAQGGSAYANLRGASFIKNGSSSSKVLLGDGSDKSWTSAATASTLVERDGSGDINCRLVRTTYGNEERLTGGIVFRVNNSSDNYLRVCSSPSAARTWLDAAPSSHSHNQLSGVNYTSGGPEKPSDFGAGKLRYQMLGEGTQAAGSTKGGMPGSAYSDIIWLSAYGADVPLANTLIFSKYYAKVGFRQQNYNATTWGAFYEFFHTGNSNSTSYDWSAKNLILNGTLSKSGGASSSWGSIDIAGSKGGWCGIHYTDIGYIWMTRSDGYTGLWKNGANVVFAFNESGALVNGTIPWARLTGIPGSFTPSAHTHNMNDVHDAATLYIDAGTVTRKVIQAYGKHNQGYISRVALGLSNPANSFSPVILSVGLNDSGTSWRDFRFDPSGNMNIDGTYNGSGFQKLSSNDNYVLLGGGGHKALTDFHATYRLHVTDNRGADRAPNYYTDRAISTFFNESIPNTFGTWASGITVKGWSSGYRAWQLFGYSSTGSSDELYFRSSTSDTAWQTPRRVWHSGNLDLASVQFVRGMIMMWSGAHTAVPAGWLLCNGANGTPDLRDKFVMGAGNVGVGETGGKNSLTLAPDNVPEHRHRPEGGIGTEDIEVQRGFLVNTRMNWSDNWPYTNGGGGDSNRQCIRRDWNGHVSFTGKRIYTEAIRNGTLQVVNDPIKPIDNRPAFYALAFIMKS